MKKFKFVGDHGPVDVPALGLEGVTKGTVVEVEDLDVSAGLDGQGSWEHIPDPVRSEAAKKAAETRASNDSQEG